VVERIRRTLGKLVLNKSGFIERRVHDIVGDQADSLGRIRFAGSNGWFIGITSLQVALSTLEENDSLVG
jgi:hypothetical protein